MSWFTRSCKRPLPSPPLFSRGLNLQHRKLVFGSLHLSLHLFLRHPLLALKVMINLPLNAFSLKFLTFNFNKLTLNICVGQVCLIQSLSNLLKVAFNAVRLSKFSPQAATNGESHWQGNLIVRTIMMSSACIIFNFLRFCTLSLGGFVFFPFKTRHIVILCSDHIFWSHSDLFPVLKSLRALANDPLADLFFHILPCSVMFLLLLLRIFIVTRVYFIINCRSSSCSESSYPATADCVASCMFRFSHVSMSFL